MTAVESDSDVAGRLEIPSLLRNYPGEASLLLPNEDVVTPANPFYSYPHKQKKKKEETKLYKLKDFFKDFFRFYISFVKFTPRTKWSPEVR